MAVISITYDDGKTTEAIGNSSLQELGYKSVDILYGDNQNKSFNSGNFVKDWFLATKFLVTEHPESLAHSSSVDHFIMDGADFRKVWLDSTNIKLIYDPIPRVLTFFMPKGATWNWQELKELCEK